MSDFFPLVHAVARTHDRTALGAFADHLDETDHPLAPLVRLAYDAGGDVPIDEVNALDPLQHQGPSVGMWRPQWITTESGNPDWAEFSLQAQPGRRRPDTHYVGLDFESYPSNPDLDRSHHVVRVLAPRKVSLAVAERLAASDPSAREYLEHLKASQQAAYQHYIDHTRRYARDYGDAVSPD